MGYDISSYFCAVAVCTCTCLSVCTMYTVCSVYMSTAFISLNGNLIMCTPLCYSIVNCLRILSLSLSPLLPPLSFSSTLTPTPAPLPIGNRVALVQAALARQLDNEDEGNPMSSRRPTASQPEPVISPSISFTDENGLANNSSQGSTSSGHLQVRGIHVTGHLTSRNGC